MLSKKSSLSALAALRVKILLETVTDRRHQNSVRERHGFWRGNWPLGKIKTSLVLMRFWRQKYCAWNFTDLKTEMGCLELHCFGDR